MNKNNKIKNKKSKELCDFCGGTLYPKTVPLEFRVKGDLMVIEDVPAEVCNRCGQKYLSSQTDADIERLLKTKPHADKMISVPVFKLTAAKANMPKVEGRA